MSINLELEKKILNLITSFNQNLFDEVIKDASDLYKEINNVSVIPNLIGASYAGKNDHENAVIFYKKALAIEVSEQVEGIYQQYLSIRRRVDDLHDVLQIGAKSARISARETLDKVYQATGISV